MEVTNHEEDNFADSVSIFAENTVAADCSLWSIGDRLSGAVTPSTRSAFDLLDQAFENPDLMNSPAFRARLARKMEEAGRDGKRYLAPPEASGPLPSKQIVKGWWYDVKEVAVCE